jgi:phosphoadenosine phosphosulfate reductase
MATNLTPDTALAFADELHGKSAGQVLEILASRFADAIAFSTSFGLEDQALTHLIFSNDLPIRVFTLDTGRMFNETYFTWQQTLDKYKKPIESFFPNTKNVEELMTTKGSFSFYESVENRQECCFVRKLEPLDRALERMRCWTTGIRAEQSDNRSTMRSVEWDAKRGIVKVHPLFDWTFAETKDFIRTNNIPYNPLHDRGFVSIGCAPCTRAVREGESFRAGRWWWEDASKKECGLHGTTTIATEPHSQ